MLSSNQKWQLTPAYDCQSPQTVFIRQEGHEDQTMQIQTLHQDPIMIGCQEIQEEGHSNLAAHLLAHRKIKQMLGSADTLCHLCTVFMYSCANVFL